MRKYLPSDARVRRMSIAAWDVGVWFLATLALIGARFDFSLGDQSWQAALLYASSAGALQVGFGFFSGLYRGHYKVGSFYEAYRLATTVAMVALVLLMGFSLSSTEYPRSVALSVPPTALLLMASLRWLYRAYFYDRAPAGSVEKAPVLVYGAGFIGTQMAQLIRATADAPYEVVGFLDDDAAKRHLHVAGSRVVGTGLDLERMVAQTGAEAVILTIARADEETIRDLTARVDAIGVKLLVIPPFEDIVRDGYHVKLNQLREVNVEDLLGRRPVQTDLSAIAGYVSGKVVLITGAGGSIGSELARQVHKFGPSELVLLDRDESGLHAVQLSIYGQGLLDTPDMVLADIREGDVLDRVFAEHRPEVVFHAAALNADVGSTPRRGGRQTCWNVERAGGGGGTGSSEHLHDKPPTPRRWQDERAAEELTAWFAGGGGDVPVGAVGNVLGSRGSMLHTFTAQIERGGPVTVTHPDITRFFDDRGGELVIQAGAIGDPGRAGAGHGHPDQDPGCGEAVDRDGRRTWRSCSPACGRGRRSTEVLFSENEAGEPAPADLPRAGPAAEPDVGSA